MSGPILALHIDEGTYILDADAFGFGLGAILSQTQFGTERVIAYSSRTLNRAEQQYETTKKELLAIVNGLKQFRQYLVGREFVIRTDHAAVVASPNARTDAAISPLAIRAKILKR